MNELLFGSVSPMWAGVPPVAWPQIGVPTMNRVAGPAFGSQPIQPSTFGNVTPFRQPFANPATDPYGLVGESGPLAQPPLVGLAGPGFAPAPTPFAFPMGYPGVFTPGIPGLLAAVAIRRGQPAGPATDQEIEDFIYDVFELLPS